MKYCGKDLWGSKQEMKNMIYNRKMLFDTDYWEVLEFKDAWQLVKHGVSMTYLKECKTETYEVFADRLLKITLAK